MSIGKAINNYIQIKEVSMYKVAKVGGITQTTLSEIVHGKNKNPKLDTLTKIAIGIGITVSDLIKKAEELEGEEKKSE